ncbi:MAG: hypothetical protein B6I24_08465 [Bacteroidetes bacterium 4572_128]|nr:MAG: hypothetical protein B6I24_08465 [Bacteroidetes bacterium 4572_128]
MNANLAVLDFVDNVVIEQRSVTYIKVKVTLKPKGFLSIWYNAIRRTQSFSIILENNRKWGFDFDNRVGWHEHPLENPNLHVSSKSKTIHEIIEKLTKVWDSVN